MGTIQLTDSIPSIEFTGSAKNLNVKALTQSEVMSEAFVDLDYEVFLMGRIERIFTVRLAWIFHSP